MPMHDYYGSGAAWGAWMIFHWLFWLLLLVLVVVAAVALMRGQRWHQGTEHTTSALDLLDQRYARGEIDREEYLVRKRDINKR